MALAGAGQAAEWRVQRADTPARVTAIDTVEAQVRVNAGGLWYAIVLGDKNSRLQFIDRTVKPKPPQGALPDGHIATGTRDIARVWLAEPTARYDHGVLGDKIEAASLVIEMRDGKHHTVRLNADAVFEDLKPRLADLDGDGHDEIVVVKSNLKHGSSLAVIAERKGKYEIVAETPPLGAPHRWLNPAGIGDFNGDGKTDIALVRQPHVVGELELWSWSGGALRKAAVLADTANHIAGMRILNMSAAADFDGDGILDIAVPSLDRSHLRLVSFAPAAREIASVALPAKAVTNIGLVAAKSGPPAVAVGLA
ncbi:MAG: VCBS repeat-containing protein, partial [Deltaproteobacteria bacterium]|nr:VCBS repeat-containing protein [Deltaproteobacteria bacterium]